jgi:hypothetical protein
MVLTYFKRYRMEFDLHGPWFPLPELPPGYYVQSWDESLLEAHARTKYLAFCEEIDACVFPSLSCLDGCRNLMREITGRGEFVPEATWLVSYRSSPLARPEFCGTIQGVRKSTTLGAVQNVGVLRAHRGRGLGSFLIYQSLLGFRRAGLRRVSLEVTAKNQAAQRLYGRLGFRRLRTVYKAAEVAFV